MTAQRKISTKPWKDDRSIRQTLTERARRFAEEYIKDLKQEEAAIRAGYSKKTASKQACALLRSPCVAEYVQKLMDKRSERTGIQADKVLEELALVAFSDIGNLFDENDKIKSVSTMPEKSRRTISSIDSEELKEDGFCVGTVRKVRMYDKLKALELIGKHLRLFAERLEVVDKTGIADRLNKAKAKLQNEGK